MQTMAQPATAERMLAVDEVAAFLGIKTSTVWAWARAGRIPAPIKLSGRCTRWRLSDLLAHVARTEA